MEMPIVGLWVLGLLQLGPGRANAARKEVLEMFPNLCFLPVQDFQLRRHQFS